MELLRPDLNAVSDEAFASQLFKDEELEIWQKQSYNNISGKLEYYGVGRKYGNGPHNLIEDIEFFSHEVAFTCRRDNFSGACYSCGALTTKEVKLKRCSGCQLVSYCNMNCQKYNWKHHKKLCKKYPVVNGMNKIVKEAELFANDNENKDSDYCTYSATEYSVLKNVLNPSILKNALNYYRPKINRNLIHKLRQSVLGGSEGDGLPSIRACNICLEARPEMLVDCRCCAVSYCSKEHRLKDESHLSQGCALLYSCAMANWYYLTHHHQLLIPDGLLNEANLNNFLKFKKISKLSKYSNEKWLKTIVNLVNERLTLPMTIHHTLKTLKLGEQRKNLYEITSLTIHIVHDTPMLDPRVWEFFLHQIPNLKTLNLTFLSWELQVYNTYNTFIPLERCSDCKKKEIVINYNIQPMRYHEYFSTDDYIEPDVVVVVGTDQELMQSGDMKCEDAHIFTSQRNMTYCNHTVVILTAYEDFDLKKYVKSFHDARPVKVLLPIKENPFCGFSTMRYNWPNFVMNENKFLCCIQGHN